MATILSRAIFLSRIGVRKDFDTRIRESKAASSSPDPEVGSRKLLAQNLKTHIPEFCAGKPSIGMHLIKFVLGDESIMKRSKILAFTILESIFVIIAVVVISFVLAGLYLKNSELSDNPKLKIEAKETK